MIPSILNMAAPLLLAAAGGLLTELAGVLNIALEGSILVGAFFAVVATLHSGSPSIGLIGGTVAGALLAGILSWWVLSRRANLYIGGLAMNLLAGGITGTAATVMFGTRGNIRLEDSLRIGELPILGSFATGAGKAASAGISPAVIAAALAAALLPLLLRRTPFGLRLRATGEYPDALRCRGGTPETYKATALIISGAACGLAGAFLALDLGVYVPGMSAGRGWVALVAIFLGRRHPAGVVVACGLFAGAQYTGNMLQGRDILPGTVMAALPYVVTVVLLVLASGTWKGITSLRRLRTNRRNRQPGSRRKPNREMG